MPEDVYHYPRYLLDTIELTYLLMGLLDILILTQMLNVHILH